MYCMFCSVLFCSVRVRYVQNVCEGVWNSAGIQQDEDEQGEAKDSFTRHESCLRLISDFKTHERISSKKSCSGEEDVTFHTQHCWVKVSNSQVRQ